MSDETTLYRQQWTCEACFYDLNGLAGDPIICPECGTRNERAVLSTPIDEIEEAVLDLETPAFWLSVTLAAIGVSFAFMELLPALAIAFSFLALSSLNVLAIRRACRSADGWMLGLARALVVRTVLLAAWTIATVATIVLLVGAGSASSTSIAWMAGLAAGIVAILILTRTHRRILSFGILWLRPLMWAEARQIAFDRLTRLRRPAAGV